MSSEDKLLYMIRSCCMDEQDLIALLNWIERESIDFVYRRVHFMFDEDEQLLLR